MNLLLALIALALYLQLALNIYKEVRVFREGQHRGDHLPHINPDDYPGMFAPIRRVKTPMGIIWAVLGKKKDEHKPDITQPLP